MKPWVVFWAGLFASASALASGPNPYYFTSLKGTLVSGLTDRGQFELTPGTISDCEQTVLQGFVAYRCQLAGASASIVQNGKAVKYDFDNKISVFYKSLKEEGWIREYHFNGVYTEKGPVPLSSKVAMVLWFPEEKPESVKGWVKLVDYEASASIQAAP